MGIPKGPKSKWVCPVKGQKRLVIVEYLKRSTGLEQKPVQRERMKTEESEWVIDEVSREERG